MQIERVFVPVSVDLRLPNENDSYTCEVHKKGNGSHSITTRFLQFNPANKSWIGLEDKEYVTHWLEEKENVYVLTEEELKEIRDALSYGEMEIKKLYKSSGYLNSNLLRFIGNALGKLQSKTNPQT